MSKARKCHSLPQVLRAPNLPLIGSVKPIQLPSSQCMAALSASSQLHQASQMLFSCRQNQNCKSWHFTVECHIVNLFPQLLSLLHIECLVTDFYQLLYVHFFHSSISSREVNQFYWSLRDAIQKQDQLSIQLLIKFTKFCLLFIGDCINLNFILLINNVKWWSQRSSKDSCKSWISKEESHI